MTELYTMHFSIDISQYDQQLLKLRSKLQLYLIFPRLIMFVIKNHMYVSSINSITLQNCI